MPNRYLIIHGHFYQPPRENPWILSIEPQSSAAPFQNWNLRINRECYAPNAQSRLLNEQGKIKRLVNNYEYLSFNFGPTLLSWMQKADPETYTEIIKADQAAAARKGHGPALAQVYNHIIMPLANTRDRVTQIRWGVTDFETRFGRRPEGMWLAETAVDLETIKLMAQEGLKFTVLSQNQAAAVRPLLKNSSASAWEDVSGSRIDPREPYRVFWGQGPEDYLDVFFYDGPVSRAIAFEKLLSDGQNFLNRLEQAFGSPKPDNAPRLVNLATDGESYGHHFAFGDMALAWLFDHLSKTKNNSIKLTNYGEYLSLFPPVKEVRIFENSSWSCVHGVERWRSDCGCNTGADPGWNQKWRVPLRNGLDKLRDELQDNFLEISDPLLKDPWLARDDYIKVAISDYDEVEKTAFIKRHQKHDLSAEEISKILALMESQLMGLYMFTSCGWFFNDIAGLEPVQNLRYALRAMELAQPWSQTDLAGNLLSTLQTIIPNDPHYKSGLDIWQQLVMPDSLSNLQAVAAHWSAAVLLEAYQALDFFNIHEFKLKTEVKLSDENIKTMAALVNIYDRRTSQDQSQICFTLYSKRSRLATLVDAPLTKETAPPWLTAEHLIKLFENESKTFQASNIWEAITKLMPDGSTFEVENLLPSARTAMLDTIVADVYSDLKEHTKEIFLLNQPLLVVHRTTDQPMDWVERFIFRVMGEAALKKILDPSKHGQGIDLATLETLIEKSGLIGLSKDDSALTDVGLDFLKNAFKQLKTAEQPKYLLQEIECILELFKASGFRLDMWACQNQWHHLHSDQNFRPKLNQEELSLMADIGTILEFDLP